jgi:tetratricopeptide (TPR) repeat protein
MLYVIGFSSAAFALRYMGVDWWFIGLSAGAFFLAWLLSDTPRRESAAPAIEDVAPAPTGVLLDPLGDIRREVQSKRNAPVLSGPVPRQSWQDTWSKGAQEIDLLVARGDWHSARTALQQAAYGMLKASPVDKRRFTVAMCQFAKHDPLLHQVMAVVTPLVNNTPGITQTKLYPHLPGVDPETVRYVLYYAAELGYIVRHKKGNSYALHPKLVANTANEDDIGALHAQATALKEAGELDEAVDKLYRAKALMLQSVMSHTAESWCKLPLYLQHAGLFEASMAEFQFLLDDLPRRARKDSRIDDPNVGPVESKKRYHANLLKTDRETIEAKISLAQKRELKNKP